MMAPKFELLYSNLSTKKVGDPQTYALAALFSFQGAMTAREPETTPPTGSGRVVARGTTAIISP